MVFNAGAPFLLVLVFRASSTFIYNVIFEKNLSSCPLSLYPLGHLTNFFKKLMRQLKFFFHTRARARGGGGVAIAIFVGKTIKSLANI